MGMGLALYAQYRLAARLQHIPLNVLLYGTGVLFFAWAFAAADFRLPSRSSASGEAHLLRVRPMFFVTAAALSLLTSAYSADNRFRALTLLCWAGAIVAMLAALWQGDIRLGARLRFLRAGLRNVVTGEWITEWRTLVLVVFVVAAYFRFYRLAAIPPEMWSDHAEKLLDVRDVLNGMYSIFFIRNTGREPLQFYIAGATARLFGTGLSFITLKIGTAAAGYLTLIYLYLFAEEYADRRVALCSVFLAGIAFWPNIISRIGLRFPFYPLFAAAALYHLLRGLRLREPNHLLLCGAFSGMGLLGYSPARVIPIGVAVGVFLLILHREGRREWRAYLSWLLGAALVALVVFLPLLRAGIEMPDRFMYRTLTRLSGLEQPIQGSPFEIFLTNVWRAMRMFAWDSGEVYVVTVTDRPLLDWLTAGLFHVGLAIVALRYLRDRSWRDLFLLLSLLILTLPSTLSIAFPNENPAPNRASGALVPVFTIASLAVISGLDWVRRTWHGRWATYVLGVILLVGALAAAIINYQLTMMVYPARMQMYIWNTSEAGDVARKFISSGGDPEAVHVVSYPHWMDTRLVAINSGHAGRDYEILPQALRSLKGIDSPQVVFVNPMDEASLSRLMELFPAGSVYRYDSDVQGKDFLVYFIPDGNEEEWEPGF
jgi:hypothetical protein